MYDDGQAGVYLEAFNNFLYERHQIVLSSLDKCGAHVERIVEIIGSYGIIPSDMVCIPPLSFLCRVVSLMTRTKVDVCYSDTFLSAPTCHRIWNTQ